MELTGAEVEVLLLAELAVDLMHVSLQLFQQALKAAEHGVERGLITGEVGADEILERSLVTIFRPPELGDLI